jgi:hypothetical protein
MEERCLYCKGELEVDDCLDIEPDGETVYMHYIGHCKECGRDYQWTDVYQFDCTKDLKLD